MTRPKNQAVRLTGFGAASVWFVCFLIVVTSLIFSLNPHLDIWFSGLFFDGQTFPLAHHPALMSLRKLNYGLGATIILAAVLILLVRPLRRQTGVNAQTALVPLAAYGIGAGLIVNGGLKEFFGRARPRDIVEFSGEQVFTGVWIVANECQSNCSFSSGEAAAAMSMFSALALIPTSMPRMRIAIGLTLSPLVAALSFNRIIFGAHFLSDTLMSLFIVSLVMLVTNLAIDGSPSMDRMKRRDGIPGASKL